MRSDIYYWKCDNPKSLQDKRLAYFQGKYERSDLADLVRSAFQAGMGRPPESLEPLRADGNHLAFVAALDGRRYLVRTDDGEGEDEYLLAESRLMRMASDAGVPTPEVFHTDIRRTVCPLRYQIMAYCAEPDLNVHDRRGTLDRPAIAGTMGQILRRLHSVRLDGYGFVDTDELQRSGRVRGLDPSCGAYFRKRLDEHLAYVCEHEFLDLSSVPAARTLLDRADEWLDRSHAVLVHRDLAFWNVLGTPDRITAVIDWDDAVGGDPADDLGILSCFYEDAFMEQVMRSYWSPGPVPEDFRGRVYLHMFRNMLWKTKIRHSLGYFDQPGSFFLNASGQGQSLRDRTLQKLKVALERAGEFAGLQA